MWLPDADARDVLDAGPAAVDSDILDAGVDSAPRSAPQVHPDDPTRLAWRGRTWVPAGYYGGIALHMTGIDFAGDFRASNDALLDLLIAGGVGYTRVWASWGALPSEEGAPEARWDAFVRTPWARTGPGLAVDGEPRLDLERFEPSYFEELERFVARADASDIVVQLVLLDCWHASFGRSHGFARLDYFAAENNVNGLEVPDEAAWFDVGGAIHAHNLAFVREVVRTVGHHENLVLETCNEPRPIEPSDPARVARAAFHVSIANVIHEEEARGGFPRHLVVPIDLPEHRSVAGHMTPSNGLAGEEPLDAMAARLPGEQRGWGVPLVSDNDCCPGVPDTSIVRRKAWIALLSGAHVSIFNNELFRREVQRRPETLEGIRAVARTVEVLEALGIDVAGRTPSRPASGVYMLSGPDGSALLALDDAESIDLGRVSDGPAVLIDPRTGETSAAGHGPEFRRPSAEDWILWVPR
ncbi:MAG: hypothetical protein K1X94_30020 [Sandaracinaceae bacterium]|nr:hypothetical protein [Sandaracinaceae bacterium]